MGKQTKSKSKKDDKGGAAAAGYVTATQVAFIVDRYLSDNNFLVTLSAFRSEASSLLPSQTTIANQSAKSLLKLGDMLDGYIRLKAEKMLLDQEKTRLEHEKSRVHNLLRGMQHVMNAYNGASAAPPPPPPPLPLSSSNPAPAACFPVPVYNMSRGGPPSNSISQQHTCYSTPPTATTAQLSSLKRRNNPKQAAPSLLPSKRSRTKSSSSATTTATKSALPTNHITPVLSISQPKTSPQLHGSSSVVKCLFNSGPQTPSPSPTDKSVDNQTPPSSNKKTVSPPTQQYTTSTNRTVITSETIQVSPMKQVSYYSIERNHCVSSPMKTTPTKRFTTNRDHVKGRLDFDASSEILHSNSVPDDENSGGSPSEDDGFDFDLPNLDCFDGDFNFSDLLGDFDLDGFCPTDNVGSSPECLSGSPDKMADGRTVDHQLLSGMSSTFTEIQSEQDMNNISGPNSVTSVKSVTKCIKVFSPVKSRRSTGSSDQEIVDTDVVA